MTSPTGEEIEPSRPPVALLRRRVRGRARLTVLVTMMLGMTVALAGFGIWRLQEVGRHLTEIAETDVPLAVAIAELNVTQHKQATQLEQSVRVGEAVERGEAPSSAFDNAVRSFSRSGADIRRRIEAAQVFIEAIQASDASLKVKEEFGRIADQLTNVERRHVNYVDRAEGLFSLLEMGQLADARILAAEVGWEVAELNKDLGQIGEQLRQLTEGELVGLRAQERDGIWGLSILAALTLLLGSMILLIALPDFVQAARGLPERVRTGEATRAEPPIVEEEAYRRAS